MIIGQIDLKIDVIKNLVLLIVSVKCCCYFLLQCCILLSPQQTVIATLADIVDSIFDCHF